MIKNFIKKRLLYIAFAVFLIISTVLGNIVMKNGDKEAAEAFGELNPIDRGQIGGFDLNTATVEQFTAIKGIGEVYSKRIIETREAMGGFKSVDELLYANGIGMKRLREIRKYVRIK